ncbi:MAG: hypothetical protein ACRD2U_01620 [Terriglobales bacterium]
MQTLSEPSAGSWRELYVAALFEADTHKLIGRIDQAERALVLRARQLFLGSSDDVEGEALEDAMYALHTLRNVYQRKTPKMQGQRTAA